MSALGLSGARLNINHRTYESLRVANLAILKPYEVTSPELFTSNLLKPYFGGLQEGVAAARDEYTANKF